MQQELSKFPIRRKPLAFNPITRLNKKRKPNPFPAPTDHDDRKNLSERQAQRNIGQNISLIAKKQQGSFISNRQDHSLDSFDKMLMGVDEQLGDLQDQNTSNSKENDPNYTLLYQQFQKLVKDRPEAAEGEEDDSNILKQSKEELTLKEEAGSNSILRQQFSQGEEGSTKLREVRRQKASQSSIDPNISLRLLGANLSEIHEEQIQHSSMNRMDPIEQQFIDFVGKNEAGRVNISNIQKHNSKLQMPVSSALKHDLNGSIKQPEEDEVVAMLENQLGSRRDIIQQESLQEKKQQPQFFQKENYPQILRELDENQDKKDNSHLNISKDNSHLNISKDNSHLNISTVLSKRQQWINSRNDRSLRWKQKELQLISKIKEILFNPYAEFSDEEDFNLSL